MTYDLIGTIHKPSGVILTDEFGNEYPQMEPIDGYHVNVLPQDDMSLVDPYIVEVNTLRRVFAGRDDTVALKFASEAQWLTILEQIENAPVTVKPSFKSLTPRQVRMTLSKYGLRDQVENLIAASDDYELKDWWQYSQEYDRYHPRLVAMAQAFALTDEQVNAMFVCGATV